MRIPLHSSGPNQRVWFSPYLFVVVLFSPVLQGISCNPPTGDATLSALEVEVMGENHISAFDPGQRIYNVWLPLSADTATVRAYSTDSGSTVSYSLYEVNIYSGALDSIDYGYFPVGGGEVTLTALLPESRSQLYISVRAPGGAQILYAVIVQVGCSDCDDGNECTTDACDSVEQVCVHNAGSCLFPCTEQGIRDAIALGGGPHTFACNGPTVVTTQAEIVIDNDVTLDGEGNLIVDGNDDHRVLSVVQSVSVALNGITVSGGRGTQRDVPGAGIYNAGTLTLIDGNVLDNRSYNLSGAAIHNDGTVTLIDSHVSRNISYDQGGGIQSSGNLTAIRTTVSENFSPDNGASIRASGGNLWLIDSSVVRNRCEGFTISVAEGRIILMNSTVSGNYGAYYYPFDAALFINSTASATIINSTLMPTDGHCFTVVALGGGSIYATNSIIGSPAPIAICSSYQSGAAACISSVNSGGGNIETLTDSCGFTDPSDLVAVSEAALNLGPLQDNGGPTETHALLPGSVALDRIPPSMCVDADGQPLTTDQRGVARPQGGACDVGAFEYADCSGSACDDGNDCTADHCNPGDDSWCAHTTLPDGSLCGTDGVCEVGACRERSWGAPAFEVTPVGSDLALSATGKYIAVGLVYGEPDPDTNLYEICLTTYPGLTVHFCQGTAFRASVLRGYSVGVDASGRAMVTWKLLSFEGNESIQLVQDFGSGWDSSSKYGPLEGTRMPFYEALLAANGDALLVWPDRGYVYAARYSLSDGWDAGTALSPEWPQWDETQAHAAIGDNGDAIVLYPGIGLSTELWSRRFTPGVGWRGAELVDAVAGPGCGLAVDSGGTATILCSGWSRRSPRSGGWTGRISTQAKGELTADGMGNVFSLWMEGEQVWSSRFTPAGNSWSAPEPIALGQSPQLAVNAEGNAIVVVATTAGISWNRFTPVGGWATAKVIDGTIGATMPKVALLPNGNATLAWVNGNQIGTSDYQ